MVGTSDTTRRCHMSTLGHCLLPPYLLCVLEHSSALRKCTWLGGSRLLVRVLSTLGRSDILAVLATLATFSNLSKQQSKQKPVDASWCQASSALSKIVALASQPTKIASTHLCPSALKIRKCQGKMTKSIRKQSQLENPRSKTVKSPLLRLEECLGLIQAMRGLLQSWGRGRLAKHAKRVTRRRWAKRRSHPVAPVAATPQTKGNVANLTFKMI